MRKQFRLTLADALFLSIAFVWTGMLAGVSFVATPVKFTAPGLSLPVALEVGRVTFHLFSRIEWVLTAALLLASIPDASRARIALAVLIAILVIIQGAWLLPALDARVDAAVMGARLPPSHHHTVYALAEAAKVLLLAMAGVSGIRVLVQSRR